MIWCKKFDKTEVDYKNLLNLFIRYLKKYLEQIENKYLKASINTFLVFI